MPKAKNPPSEKGARRFPPQTSLDKFSTLLQRADEVARSDRSNAAQVLAYLENPREVPWEELGKSWLGERLRECKQEHDAQVFKLLLNEFLANIGAYPPPSGVFTPWPKTGKPGATVKPENESIFRLWEKEGRPPMSKLAWKVYGRHFGIASGPEQRKMRDKCRQAVLRAVERRSKRAQTR